MPCGKSNFEKNVGQLKKIPIFLSNNFEYIQQLEPYPTPEYRKLGFYFLNI